MQFFVWVIVSAAIWAVTSVAALAQQPPSAQAAAHMTMDCRVGEMDAAEKGVHCLVAKSMWKK